MSERYMVRNIVRVDKYYRTGNPDECNGCPHHKPPKLPWGNLNHLCGLGAEYYEDYRSIRPHGRHGLEGWDELNAAMAETCKRPGWCRQRMLDAQQGGGTDGKA